MSEALRDGNRVTTELFESSTTPGLTLNGQIDQSTGRILVSNTAGGDIVGPASSTDNAVARWDGTTGKLLQNSLAILDDAGNLTLPGGTTGVPGLTVSSVAAQNAELWVSQASASLMKIKAQIGQMRVTTNGVPILFDSDDAGTLMAGISTTGLNAPGYAVAGVAGVSGSFVAGTKTVTVVHGIITAIV